MYLSLSTKEALAQDSPACDQYQQAICLQYTGSIAQPSVYDVAEDAAEDSTTASKTLNESRNDLLVTEEAFTIPPNTNTSAGSMSKGGEVQREDDGSVKRNFTPESDVAEVASITELPETGGVHFTILSGLGALILGGFLLGRLL